MKKLICALAIVTTLCNSGLIYPAAYRVTKVNRKTDIVTVESSTGNRFRFRGCEDWCKDDLCVCIMWSNGTKRVYDDQILAARYGGFVIK